MMWKKGIKNLGRIVSGYVSFIDLAPSFLDLAEVDWDKKVMHPTPGKSLRPILRNPEPDKPFREFFLVGKERHDVGCPDDYGYPIRGIVRAGWLFLVNYRNDLWPAGNPRRGYTTVAGSPTKIEVLKSRYDTETSYLLELSFGNREKEDLYDLERDRDCIHNLADNQLYSDIKEKLIRTMEAELKKESDPRMYGRGEIFHTYRFSDERWRSLYNRMVVNE